MSSADTTVSAYDLLSEEDREALDWVRDHGGIDALCSELPVLAYRASLVGRVYEALGIDPDEPNAAMLLASEVKRLRDDHDALLWMDEHGGLDAVKDRLMPEGMSWPRFEDSEPVRIRDEAPLVSDTMDVTSVELSKESFILHGWGYEIGCNCQVKYRSGERVKRSVPKVLDADGVEIRVGDTVYVEGREYTVKEVHGRYGTVEFEADEWTAAKPCAITHRAPVLAADGRPLRVGDDVWCKVCGGPLTVEEISTGGIVYTDCHKAHTGEDLTHELPDSWGLWRSDMEGMHDPRTYCRRRGIGGDDCDDLGVCACLMADDMERRARALAERDA